MSKRDRISNITKEYLEGGLVGFLVFIGYLLVTFPVESFFVESGAGFWLYLIEILAGITLVISAIVIEKREEVEGFLRVLGQFILTFGILDLLLVPFKVDTGPKVLSIMVFILFTYMGVSKIITGLYNTFEW